MFSNLKVRDASGWTMFIFGVLALLFGLLGLFRPELLLSILGFAVLERGARATGDYTVVFTIASSMASFNIGVYYILATLNNLKQFYKWTVPFPLPDVHHLHYGSAEWIGARTFYRRWRLGIDRCDCNGHCPLAGKKSLGD